MQGNGKPRRVPRRPPPLRSCVGGCGELGRSWSLHFLCDTCRDEAPDTCFKCAAKLDDGRLVCRSCGHRNAGASTQEAEEGTRPRATGIPF